MEQVLLWIATVGCVIASAVWGRSARYRERYVERLARDGAPDALVAPLRADVRKDLHTTFLYAVLAVVLGFVAVVDDPAGWTVAGLVLLPVGATLVMGRRFVAEARDDLARSQLEARAQAVLDQDDLAPARWAARLAPEAVTSYDGFEVGTLYQAGTGHMAGDFSDVFRAAPDRLVALVGDVAGHGIEPAITAFQAKSLLRVFLRQYRDPAQALEELNAQLTPVARDEEFISLVLIVVDTTAGTMRYVSAGHPDGWFWQSGSLVPLPATGPLLMVDGTARYHSRELPIDRDDLVVLSTDGLLEARQGGELFGDERVAALVPRDPGVAVDVLCKSLLDAAVDFAEGPLNDDVAILALRRT